MAQLESLQRRPGRPRKIPTVAQRRLVARMRADGETFARIAAAVGYSVPTVKRAFASELFVNDPKVVLRLAVHSYNQAMRGNATHLKQWLSLLPAFNPPKPVVEKELEINSQAWWEEWTQRERMAGRKIFMTLALTQEAQMAQRAWESQILSDAREERRRAKGLPV